MAKNNKENPSYGKSEFLQILSCATPEEINEIIKEKGKSPKAIPLVIFY